MFTLYPLGERLHKRVDRRAREPFLVGCPHILFCFAQTLVTADRHDAVRAASKLGQAAAGSLAQSMRAVALRQSGLLAPFAEQIAEAGRRKRPAVFGNEERHVV